VRADRAAFRRRRLSLTSLIDVIFLLLLFFMLSSIFSRFGELPLVSAGPGAAVAVPLRFLQLGPQDLRLNGDPLPLDALAAALDGAGPVLVALAPEVTAQRLTDLLAVLRDLPGLSVTVLE